MTDQEFIDGIKREDKKIECRFYALHYPMVEKMILQNNGSPEDAKDIYQDAIVTVFFKIKKEALDQRTASLKTYVYSVARNKWLYHLRENRKVAMIALTDTYHELVEDNELKFEEEEKHKKAAQALEMINELCVKIIKAFYFEKMTMAKMASKFGYKDENSMKKRKSLCMKAARENLILITKRNYNEKLF